uniref:MYCL proto-oncogene, bHLH transcription factor a n=1 Tax=Myripristis murdjan TaxID=586833 RepID=A0A667ZVT2_9TELE
MWSSFSASKQLEKVSGRLSTAAQIGVSPVAQISVRPSKAQCVSPGAPLAASTTDYDEEEIDVVTVESKQNRTRQVNGRKPVTITVRADPCPKRFHMSVHRQQHNYAARSPDKDESEEEPQCKRTCQESSQQPGSSARLSHSASNSDSPQSSDTEDSDRRRNHNFLERKRRNDLRSRFLALRDQIPGLVESAKTPKVAILTQATEYLVQLHTREKQQVQEKKRLKARQQQLLRKITCHCQSSTCH